MKIKRPVITALFLIVEAVLYFLILTTNNKWYMFSAITLCFAYCLIIVKNGDKYIAVALGFTLIADFFLVLCTEQQRVWGMVFFLGAQTVYALRLQRRRPQRGFMIFRIALIIVAEVVTFAILGSNVDLLAVISLCYYANLIVSIVEGFSQFTVNKLFPIGMLLFLMCDTVIGLQNAAGSYLLISPESILMDILYPGFNLAWLFYLPSQVMLSVCSSLNVQKEDAP